MRVTGGSGARPIAGVRQRMLLGALLAHANQSLSADRLAEFVWEDAPPGRAVPTLRTYMTRLRQDLGPAVAPRIRTKDRGYLVEVGPGELDALVFEALCTDTGGAVRAADWATASDRAASALALWRGIPLEDVPSQALRDLWLPSLDQQRLQVTEWRMEAELRLCHHEQVVPQLRKLIAEHPLHERFRAQLIRGLASCGRQAEALAAYHDARKVIVEELGIEPGPELRTLHENVLAGDSDAVAPRDTVDLVSSPVPSADIPVMPVPRQLPAAAGHFTGRHGEMDLITGLPGLSQQTDDSGATVVISAIDGMAGIGKTALAVRAAHCLAGQFPDGQLFVDLHGHTKGFPPREPGEVLGSLLRGLGVPAARIPAEPEERAAFYRQRLAGTRTLIVLDNALNEAQVRPLMPGEPGCLVIVTSRRRLKGLHDAHVVALDVLPGPDALALLRTMITPQQAASAERDLAELAALCGHLPLALRVAGALLRHRPAWTPAYLAGLLRDDQERLAALSDDDHDLHAVFDLSYAGLGEQQRLLFRRLALVPGPELDKFAAAALLDAGPAAAARLLEHLVDHNLLAEPAPGRYKLHDLIRVHGRALAAKDPKSDSDDALDRLLRYYAHTAHRASALIARYPQPATEPSAAGCAPALTSPAEARAWLRAEYDNLEAASDHAREFALDEYTVTLAAGLAEILRNDGPLARALDLHQAAAGIAERHNWIEARATALTHLAPARLLAGDVPGATGAATRALEICRAVGHRHGEAGALLELAPARLMMSDFAGGADVATQALEIYRSVGDRQGEAAALIELGRARYLASDLADAADALTRALKLYRSAGRRHGEASALTYLGFTWIATGNFAGAADAAIQALEIYRSVGDRQGEATALIELGRVRYLEADFAGAADAATVAARIHRSIGHRHGEANATTDLGRARLAAGDIPGAGTALSEGLETYRAIGSRNDEAWALNHYAAYVAATGDLPRARALYEQSLAMNRDLSKPDDEAVALEGLAECHLSEGHHDPAVACLTQALQVYQRLGMKPDTDRVRARLELEGIRWRVE